MLESKKRIESLITAANETTSGSAANLTEAVQGLCDWCDGLLGMRSITTLHNERIGYIRPYAFCSRNDIKTVDLPNVTGIGANAFADCEELTSVNCPSVVSVGGGAFEGCLCITNMYLPQLQSVFSRTFKGCIRIKILDFTDRDGVQYIAPLAFYDCTSLETLILRGSCVPELHDVNAFGLTPIANGTGYIYVPRALVDSYKTETNWTVYADQIRALEDYTVDGTTTGALDESKI